MRYSSGDLLGYAALTFTLHLHVHAEGGVACKDLQGRTYESGYHYAPGPEPCTLCICDNGNPKWCKAFICKFLEEDCKSFRRGDICCEVICLDDTLSSITNEKPDGAGGTMADGNTNYDIGLRSVASFVTAILSLSLLFFLIHRLRQRKIRVCVAGRQSRQLAEEQRNLGTMGYLERGGLQHGVPMDDMPCGAGYPLWKPPGNYFPRGEAPPPYEEAVAAARAEQALLSMSSHVLSSPSFPNSYIPNANTSVAVVASTQDALSPSSPSVTNNNVMNASPLISSSSRQLSPSAYSNYHQTQCESTSTAYTAGTSTTSFTMGTNIYENLPAPMAVAIPSFNEQHGQHPAPNSVAQTFSTAHSTISKNYWQHTTFPRQSGAFTISATLPSATVSTHRTIPRTLTVRPGARMRELIGDRSANEFFHLQPRCPTPENLPRSAPPTVPTHSEVTVNPEPPPPPPLPPQENVIEPPPPATSQPEKQPLNFPLTKAAELKRSLKLTNEINEEGSFDSVTCTCSMQALPTLHDDADDYRSECENCKSATGSRYYLDNEDELVTSPHETMTLHRRPEEATSSTTPQYYRTSLTLPTNTRQRTRSSGVRENWFSTSWPQSSTESSDEN